MRCKKLGHIISGSLVEGLVMRLESDNYLESVKTGKFVSIQGKEYRFFSLITNLELQVTNQDILLFPPEDDESILKKVLSKRDIYAKVELRPMLMLDKNGRHMPVKTIPAHFSIVCEASKDDVAMIFGDEIENSQSKIRLRSGQTTMISGLIKDIKEVFKTKAPILGDIPIIGWFFRGSRRAKRDMQLLIFITPTVI